MWDCALAAPVQAWVVTRTCARIRRVQIMECGRKRWQVIVRRRLTVLALHRALGRARFQPGWYTLRIKFLVGIGVGILDQGHCGLGRGAPGDCVVTVKLRPHFGPSERRPYDVAQTSVGQERRQVGRYASLCLPSQAFISSCMPSVTCSSSAFLRHLITASSRFCVTPILYYTSSQQRLAQQHQPFVTQHIRHGGSKSLIFFGMPQARGSENTSMALCDTIFHVNHYTRNLSRQRLLNTMADLSGTPCTDRSFDRAGSKR
jgi:hypothetical protein